MKALFPPEGRLLYTPENQAACASRKALLHAMTQRRILEGRVLLCGADHSLLVRVGQFVGSIPREQAALGIAEGTTREIAILSRVGKTVSFTVDAVEGPEEAPVLLLSRRRAQELALQHMMTHWQPGQIIPATVTHLEPFGAFVDIGCGVPSMISIENLSVSRIPHPGRRLTLGQHIHALVTQINHDLPRIHLSHKQLLGTWAENAARIQPGMTLPGYVRSKKDYGVFIELFPNLSGLAEPDTDLQEGDRVSVYIKSILPDRRKIKLRVLERLPREDAPTPLVYFQTEGRLEQWVY